LKAVSIGDPEYKQISLSIWREVGNDFFRRNTHPLFFEPRVPNIVGVKPVVSLDFESGLDRVGFAAAR
jgi:hypothetical protein